MKGVVTAAVITIALVLTVVIILTINNYQTRKNEVQEALAVSLDQAMESLKLSETSYTPENYQDFISDLLQQIILQINSDSDIKINVLNLDLDHGIIDVEVVEYYKWANMKKEIAERRTVVLEEYSKDTAETDESETQENRTVHVTFKSNGVVYAELDVNYGEPVTKPTDPGVTNYTFKGWYLEGDASTETLDEADWEYLCPSEDMTFIAKFVASN